MADKRHQQEQQLESRYKIREVTHMQASWTEQERGAPGKFTIQLILDHGADEYILQPAADDIDGILKMFAASNHAMFDLERKVLMFGNLKVK